MSNASPILFGGTSRKSILRPVLIVLVFAVLGPLFGLLSLMVVSVFHTALADPLSFADKPSLLGVTGGLAFLYVFSLVYGGIQALFVGIVAGWTYRSAGRVTLRVVMAAAAVACALFLLVTAVRAGGIDLPGIGLALLAHAVAAFCCWLIVARWRSRGLS
jgi:hypothetical protein